MLQKHEGVENNMVYFVDELASKPNYEYCNSPTVVYEKLRVIKDYEQ